jgi:putative flippase GtrA
MGGKVDLLERIECGIRSRTSPRFHGWFAVIRFLAVGGLNTAFGYGLYAFLIWVKLPPEVALLLGTVGGVLFNFVTYGKLAFNRPINRGNLVRFLANYAVLYVVNAIPLHLMVARGLSAYLAQLILMPLMVIVSFFSLRYFVFLQQKPVRRN